MYTKSDKKPAWGLQIKLSLLSLHHLHIQYSTFLVHLEGVKDIIQVVSSKCQISKSFEYIERKIISKSRSYLFIVLYHLPPWTKNSITVPHFNDEFGRYLESVLITRRNLVICGDFNFQFDNPSHPDAQKFQALLNSTGLK